MALRSPSVTTNAVVQTLRRPVTALIPSTRPPPSTVMFMLDELIDHDAHGHAADLLGTGADRVDAEAVARPRW